MGFDYLDKKNWIDITREERFFCAYLYFDIKKDVNNFINWLNENTLDPKYNDKKIHLGLDVKQEWDVGFEVCFYRDYKHQNRESVQKDYSPKRTFDLCLFSPDTIIIIEAKVQQDLDVDQINIFNKDRNEISSIIKENMRIDIIKEERVIIIPLVTSGYAANSVKHSNSLLQKFNGYLTWAQLIDLFRDTNYGVGKKNIYSRAEEVYQKG